MIGHLGPDLDQPFYDPLHGSPDFLALEVERPEHMEKIVGDNAHEQPGLIGLEPATACFVPAKGALALLDPILNIVLAIVCFNHLDLGQSRIR